MRRRRSGTTATGTRCCRSCACCRRARRSSPASCSPSPSSPSSQELSDGQQIVYLGLVVLAALSSIIALAPVAAAPHAVPAGAPRASVVRYGHAALITALADRVRAARSASWRSSSTWSLGGRGRDGALRSLGVLIILRAVAHRAGDHAGASARTDALDEHRISRRGGLGIAQFAPTASTDGEPPAHRRARRERAVGSRGAESCSSRVFELLRRPLRRVARTRTPQDVDGPFIRRAHRARGLSTACTSWQVFWSAPATAGACATRWWPSTARAAWRTIASSTCTTRSASASRTGWSRARSRRRRRSTLAGLRFGLMTCYDLRFPEVGASAGGCRSGRRSLVPAEWVRGPLKEHHWRTLLHARAIENTVYRRRRRPPAAARGGQLDDRRSAGRRGSRPWAPRRTSPSRSSTRRPWSACGASTLRCALRRFGVDPR